MRTNDCLSLTSASLKLGSISSGMFLRVFLCRRAGRGGIDWTPVDASGASTSIMLWPIFFAAAFFRGTVSTWGARKAICM